MASTSRLGGVMLSRLATPSRALMLPSRAFSTSIALRDDNRSRSSQPARVNPLIGGNTVRTEPPKPAKPAAASPPPAEAPSPSPPTSTLSDIPPPPPPAAAAESTPEPDASSRFSYTAAATQPNFNLDIASIIANKSAAYAATVSPPDATSRPQVRAKAVTGRTVFIAQRTHGADNVATTPANAFMVLGRMVRKEQVKNKFHSQKFHERKGLKRKRLRSQRWRARFKTGFKATAHRVMELTRQGW